MWEGVAQSGNRLSSHQSHIPSPFIHSGGPQRPGRFQELIEQNSNSYERTKHKSTARRRASYEVDGKADTGAQ